MRVSVAGCVHAPDRIGPVSAQLLPLPTPPLSEEHSALLARLVQSLDSGGLWWLSGYTAALAQHRAVPGLQAKPSLPVAQESARLSIVYGSQTGNARRVAEQLARETESAGLTVRLLRADAYPTRELATERLLYVVISTQGEGDPPDDARTLVEFLSGKRAPKLPELKYAVLGLGDSSYPLFNATGRQIDARLAELGASRLLNVGEADVDVDTVAAPWRAQALAQAREALKPAAPLASVTPLRPPTVVEATTFTRDRPFAAELLLNQRITARDSGKEVRHLELSLAGSGLSYQPGDALGVWHRNPSELVDDVLDALELDVEQAVTQGDETLSLREWLSVRRELSKLSRPLLAAHAALAEAADLNRALAPSEQAELAALLSTHQFADVQRRWPAAWNASELVAALRPLTPRLYSIASSQAEVGEEAHLTLDVLRYEAHGRTHGGAASGHLAQLAEGDAASIYIEANERFRLPVDAARDVIMIGPGTGVAPFRGFVQERAAQGARGRNWLFFGNPHFRRDFLYQTEWQAALATGALHRLDLAFSRDGLGVVDGTGRIDAVAARKSYVQHRLGERAREVYAWLEGGAHLYVCGAIRMGKDVHAALRDIVERERSVDAEAAEEYLSELQRAGRYAKDVY
jgi:sulfite reductase (NADPH) flavoprotein alpha-component